MSLMEYKAKKILFLGYSDKETPLHSILLSRGCQVEHACDKIINTSNFDLIISFGYRYIIPNEIIINSCPIVNLHISYLPFNRGSHPNFWSHFDETPSGVTIHLIDKGVDTGLYLFRERVFFDIKKLTFKESYQILINEIESLFIHNIDQILSLDFEPKEYEEKGTFHSSADLPIDIDWNKIISDQLEIIQQNK